ncbi:MAG: ParB N-terminal domain-containing protein [Clostridia bacterium]|nr:ParB N-terminal domain-containing protein [Clostridia bacterium]
MRIERKRLADLAPAPYNPRKKLKPGDREYERLRRSIVEFGYVDPIVWNERTGNVVGGHQRLNVLMELGIEEAEVSVVDLDPEKEKALNLALNKIQGERDEEKLAELLQELSKSEAVDVELSGFGEKEIRKLLERMEEKGQKREGVEEWVEELGERHDYVVLYFDNELDRLKAWQVLGIKERVNIRWGKWDSERVRRELGQKKLGCGRIMRGAPVIEFLAAKGYRLQGEDERDADGDT